jgi:hypothetical protein
VTAPLSERVRRALQSDVLGWEYVGIVSEEDDVLVAEVAGLEAELVDLKDQILMKDEAGERLKAENTRLRDEIVYITELNNGLNYCSEESDKKAKTAEARLAAVVKGMCDFHCDVFKDFPDPQICGERGKPNPCKRFFFCESVSAALGASP